MWVGVGGWVGVGMFMCVWYMCKYMRKCMCTVCACGVYVYVYMCPRIIIICIAYIKSCDWLPTLLKNIVENSYL